MGIEAIVERSILGRDVKLWHGVIIFDSKIGEGTQVASYTEIGGSEIGDYCRIGYGCFIPPGVWIGNKVFISPRVVFSNDKWPSVDKCFGSFKPEKIFVGDYVVIGANSTILPGISIGRNSFIGAGSVVTRDVPPYALVMGNPAKIKRYLKGD